MIAAVVPVKNEESFLKRTIETLLSISCDLVIPVINGSTDSSQSIVQQQRTPRINPLYFKEALGIDVPRAVGAKAALDQGASAVLFVDGDMSGNIADNLKELISKVASNSVDMALTNCYPAEYMVSLSSLATSVLRIRRKLNRVIGLEQVIGGASPSHGPHAVSSRFLRSVPLREMAIPPVSLGLAAKTGLEICVGTTVPHKALGSPERGPLHAELIAKTIIGDCLEAIQAYRGEKRTRSLNSVDYDGYHTLRRWDLLDDFLAGP